jgi:hypothetical protein
LTARLGRTAQRRPGRRLRCCRRGRGIARRLIVLVGFDQTQSRDIFLMLLVGFRKDVTAGAVGYEIKFARARRIGGGFQ